MLVKTEAIVLHTIKYGESRLIVDLFTREQGRLSCIVSVHGARGKGLGAKKHGGRSPLFQPLSLIELECDVRPKANLQQIRDVRMLVPYASLPYEPSKMAISLFLAEFLYHALRGEQQPDLQQFDYMKNSLLWLDAASDGYANFHLVFLIHLSRFLGYYPLHQDFQNPEEAALIQTMMEMDFDNMHQFRMSHANRNRCLDAMLAYYRRHLPSFPELKSLPVLKELFA